MDAFHFFVNSPETPLPADRQSIQASGMGDEDYLDLIDQAFLEGQIDGDALTLASYWVEVNPASVQ